jgi:uncharacterized protein involved in exopolysaccharide biosynthesis
MQKMTHDEDWKRELGHVFFARRSLILTTAAIVFAGAVLIALFWPATYTASSSMLVLGKRSQISPAALDVVELRDPKVTSQDITSELEIIRSSELIRRVVQNVQQKQGGAVLADGDLLDRIASLRKRLEAVGVEDSSAIHLLLSAGSPEEAELELEALLDEYVLYRASVFNPEGQSEFFADRMEYYQKQHEAKIAEMLEKGDNMSPEFLDHMIAGNLERMGILQESLGELEVELAASTYKENSELRARIATLNALAEKLKNETSEVQAKRMAVDGAYRQAQLMKESLDIFAKRAEEAKINDSIAHSRLAGDVSILSRAKGTATLVFPRKGIVIFMGLAAALLVGMSLGFLAEFFDHTVRRTEDVQRYSDLPVLGSFPILK